MSGVKSYGDMVANFEGLKFWSSLTGNGLDGRQPPYLSCSHGHWFQGRFMDMAEYVNEGMDEGINCSQYQDEEMAGTIRARLRELENRNGILLTCPVVPEACQDLQTFYGKYASQLLHPKCLQAR